MNPTAGAGSGAERHRARAARRGRLGTLARHHRRGRQRDPADRVPGELPAGVSALEPRASWRSAPLCSTRWRRAGRGSRSLWS